MRQTQFVYAQPLLVITFITFPLFEANLDMFSDHNYNLVWGNRQGFAKVATDAKVVSL